MRTVDDKGYIRVRDAQGKLTYEHIVVAEQKLGRKLGINEVVHHLNKDKGDNTPNNLIVFRTDADHTRSEKCGNTAEIFQTRDGSHICVLNQIACAGCNRLFVPSWSRQRFCSFSCGFSSRSKFNDVDVAVFAKQVWEMPATKVAELYGVSDKAIKKWCAKLGIDKPSRGYWTRKTCGYE